MRGEFSCPFAFSKLGTDIKHREVIMINRTRIYFIGDWFKFIRFVERVVFQKLPEVIEVSD